MRTTKNLRSLDPSKDVPDCILTLALLESRAEPVPEDLRVAAAGLVLLKALKYLPVPEENVPGNGVNDRLLEG